MEAGREFHKRGAEHEKDLSPKYFVFALGIRVVCPPLVLFLHKNWSERYFGL